MLHAQAQMMASRYLHRRPAWLALLALIPAAMLSRRKPDEAARLQLTAGQR